jgi:PKD repeat protein
LTVTNDRGVAASTTKNVPVSASPNPSAEFVFSPTTPRVGDRVFFNGDQSTAAVGRRIVRYDWDFGDGTTATGSSTSHQYAAANVYVVQLKVTDDLGQVGTKSTSVTILP